MISQKKLILFDVDGVILDSRLNMQYAWEEVQTRLGVVVSFESYFNEIGRPFENIMSRLGLKRVAKEAEQIFRITSMEHLHLAQFYDHVPETLVTLQSAGYKLGVVTSKDTLRTNAVLALLPINFATIQTPNENYRGKPAPDHLLLALAETNTDPADAIYIGDSDSDYYAAQRSCIDYIHAEWGYGKVPRSDLNSLTSFKDLPNYLRAQK
jgi:phosphoglycolate phosphatase